MGRVQTATQKILSCRSCGFRNIDNWCEDHSCNRSQYSYCDVCNLRPQGYFCFRYLISEVALSQMQEVVYIQEGNGLDLS